MHTNNGKWMVITRCDGRCCLAMAISWAIPAAVDCAPLNGILKSAAPDCSWRYVIPNRGDIKPLLSVVSTPDRGHDIADDVTRPLADDANEDDDVVDDGGVKVAVALLDDPRMGAVTDENWLLDDALVDVAAALPFIVVELNAFAGTPLLFLADDDVPDATLDDGDDASFHIIVGGSLPTYLASFNRLYVSIPSYHIIP